MSKFRFYITDTFDGDVKGTNSEILAEFLAASEDYFVVDTEKGEWLNANEGRVPVPKFDDVEGED